MPIRIFPEFAAGREFILANREMTNMTLSPRMREGVRSVFGQDLTADEVVDRILADVKSSGDAALRHYTQGD